MLQERPDGWSPRELAEVLGTDEATVVEDLRHLQRSAKRTGLALAMLPARCKACGWEAAAEEPKAPGRCARCRATALHDPRFRVIPR